MRYYCSRSAGIHAVRTIGSVMDRAPRPYTVAELSEITGIPMLTITGFMIRNLQKGTVSVRYIPRAESDSGKRQGEYWRGQADIAGTFGRGHMITQEQARDATRGRRPVEWKETGTVWSIDETDTLAVRRGEQVIRMGRVQAIEADMERMSVEVRDGPRMEFPIRPRNDTPARRTRGTPTESR